LTFADNKANEFRRLKSSWCCRQAEWQKSLAIPMHKATNVAMKFEGKCHELKGSVYDVVSGKDSFTKMSDQRNL
jgi:hypothetical protein